ncbi:MAG: response regulator [Bacteroidia bacterium]|nr:response regulator [Bacteroidia bacterium]
MKILYIEDDQIDQMGFSRLCKKLNAEISYVIVDSLESLKKLEELDSFDLIFSDIFLGDGDINKVLELLGEIQPYILSGEADPGFIQEFVKAPFKGVYEKPLTKEILEEVMGLKSEETESLVEEIREEDYTAIKLANLHRLSKGSNKEMIELMEIALDLLPQRLEELEEGFEEEDWGKVHFSAHSAKGVSRLVGIPVYNELAELDRKAREEAPDPEELFHIYQGLLPIMKQAFDELNHLKNKVSLA